MDIPKEEQKKLGIPVVVFLVCVLLAGLGSAGVTYLYFPQVKLIQQQIEQNINKEPEPLVYKSEPYAYTFSYPGDLRLERTSKSEGGYVQESIDLYEPTGKIRMSVKVISKKGVQCPYYSLDQFVHCAFLRWQNLSSAPVNIDGKKGIRLVSQSQLAPYDLQVTTYFEKGDNIFEVNDFVSPSSIDDKYTRLLQALQF